jgi:hypothetical protein
VLLTVTSLPADFWLEDAVTLWNSGHGSATDYILLVVDDDLLSKTQFTAYKS